MRRTDTRAVYDDENSDQFLFSVTSPDSDGDIELRMGNGDGSTWMSTDEAIELHTALGLALGLEDGGDA